MAGGKALSVLSLLAGVLAAPAPMVDERKCSGLEQQHDACPDLPECVGCEPVDCEFGAWTGWERKGGCSRLKLRSRTIAKPNNECGKPCEGPLEDTATAEPTEEDEYCDGDKSEDCDLSEWGAWSECKNELEQSTRTRTILKKPKLKGLGCTAPLSETQPCGKATPKDCVFSEWGAWTECSAKCDGGHKMMFRRILKHPELGGAPCVGPLQLTHDCNTNWCKEDKNCIFEEWAEWTKCGAGKRQRYRSRAIKQHRAGAGFPCEGPTHETEKCKARIAEEDPCEVSQWTSWTQCDRSCGGGQTYRSRIVQDEGDAVSRDCSEMSLHDVKPCNTEMCPTDSDCKFSDWQPWDKCSVDCGDSVQKRKRSVLHIAENFGEGCKNSTLEVRGCTEPACHHRDCKWGEWGEWSACSASCDGGTRNRDRHVAVAPLGEGKLCTAEDKEEVAPCNTHSCGTCVDGSFLEWGEWSPCSATCGVGFLTRHREIGTHPNYCGKPVGGLTDEYETCDTNKPCIEAVDCELSEWSPWGDCSSTCSGVMQRSRNIKVYAAGTGKSCETESLKELKTCDNSGDAKCTEPEPKGCRLSHWGDWEPCSKPCAGGQRTRSRSVFTPAQLGGTPCKDAMLETEACNSDKICDDMLPVDCVWGEWKEWGGCTGRCGGQKFRHRMIQQYPNGLGKACDTEDSKETTACDSECDEERFCTWGTWSEYSDCSAMCGPSTKMRSRSLSSSKEAKDYLFKAGEDMVCGGSQMEVSKCPQKDCSSSCEPDDAKFSSWSSWSGASCIQLCERYRTITSPAKCGGLQATGPLVETKHCKHQCKEPEDCKIGEWQDWSHCADPLSQRTRTRAILQMPTNGGKTCAGSLQETGSCSQERMKASPCRYHDWSRWSECSVSCGSGFHKRQRRISHAAQHGGLGCTGDLEEVKTCVVEEQCTHDQDCKLGDWNNWSECFGLQQTRQRAVVEEAMGNGAACQDQLKEIRACSLTVDCEVTEWAEWDDCDKTCGGGQQQRQRQITTHPSLGGATCPPVLMETQGCNSDPCGKPQKCDVSDWSSWTECSASCGVATKTRSRHMISAFKCDMPLVEVADCGNAACEYKDCVWDDWAEWSSCTCRCGGGHRERNRHIKVSPDKGGKACELSDKEQVETCNTQPCSTGPCIDGEWDDWTEWEVCSTTCHGGTTWRTRRVTREANDCGQPVVGASREMMECNLDTPCEPAVDCTLREWSDWSSCTQPCQGVKRRSRVVGDHARAGGKPCSGALKQTAPCNEFGDPGNQCTKEVSKDCELNDWESWGICSVSCGGGQRARSRSVKTQPEFGGKSCEDPLQAIEPCGTEPCVKPCEKQDCEWGDWQEWGSCDKCGGQKRRHRHVKRHAKCEGAPCTADASEETVECTRHCHKVAYCSWAEWGEWGTCGKTCGKGTRVRERKLALQTAAEASTRLASSYSTAELEELRAQTQPGLESRHAQELVVAFASGGLSIFLVLAAVRVWSSRRLTGSVDVSASRALVQETNLE